MKRRKTESRAENEKIAKKKTNQNKILPLQKFVWKDNLHIVEGQRKSGRTNASHDRENLASFPLALQAGRKEKRIVT